VLLVFGEEKFNHILAEMDESSRNVLSHPINSSERYDLEIYKEFLRAYDKILGRIELSGMSRYNFKKQITGLYGIVLRFLSIDRVFKFAQQM
jgi:hypothetical protein